jgi:cyanosortase A-associated protein
MTLPLPTLRLTFVAIVIAFSKTVLDPNLGKMASYSFPAQVPLRAADRIGGDPMTVDGMQGHRYEYRVRQRQFEIKSYYIQNSHGEISNYASAYLTKRILPQHWTYKQNHNGFYGLAQDRQILYLSACINSKGKSTATREQFFANRNQQDLQFQRLIPVLLGREDLRDNRCLWVTIATSIANQPLELVTTQLEAVWQDWYTWWSPRFPPL